MFCRRCGNVPISFLDFFSGFRIGNFRCRFCEAWLKPGRPQVVIYIFLPVVYAVLSVISWFMLMSDTINLSFYRLLLLTIIAVALIADLVIYFKGSYRLYVSRPDPVFDDLDRSRVTLAAAVVAFLIALINVFINPVSYLKAATYIVLTVYLTSRVLIYRNLPGIKPVFMKITALVCFYLFVILVIVSVLSTEVITLN